MFTQRKWNRDDKTGALDKKACRCSCNGERKTYNPWGNDDKGGYYSDIIF